MLIALLAVLGVDLIVLVALAAFGFGHREPAYATAAGSGRP
jgi:hypothetical protein